MRAAASAVHRGQEKELLKDPTTQMHRQRMSTKDLKQVQAQPNLLLRGYERIMKPLRIRFAPRFVKAYGQVRLGRNVRFIAGPVVIGDNVDIWRNAEICGPVHIGNGTSMARDAYLRPGTHLEDNVGIGPFVKIITDQHEIGGSEWRAGPTKYDPVVVKSGSWIGGGSTIFPGVTIGPGSVVAGGSVVIRDVPPNTLVGGVPAKVIKTLD
jgi:maltose O-acetyltransferase